MKKIKKSSAPKGTVFSRHAVAGLALLLFSVFALLVFNLYKQVDKVYPDTSIFDDGNMTLTIVATLVCAVSSCLIFYYVIKYSMRSELQERAVRLAEGARSLENQTYMNNSLGSMFYCAALVNLEADNFEVILPCDFITQEVGEKGKFTLSAGTLVRTHVMENDQMKLREFLELDNLDRLFRENESHSAEFLSNYVGWSRMVVIAADRDSNHKVTKALFAFMRIDEQKKRDLQIQVALKDALEVASSANDAKSDFLSKMSHDLRTPMNGILGMTALAATRLDDKERVKYCLDKINEAGRHLVSIVDEVLDMSRIESGRVELKEDYFSLSDLMDSLITIIHPQIDAKHQDLRVNVNNIEHEKVIGDATRLQEVFSNLCSNAIKYTPDGGSIVISLTEISKKNDSVSYEFFVQDNGVGMSKEYQEHLFEPFIRESSERTKTIQGTGLGLPIAKNLINMMGGDLVAESEENKGSKFIATFTLKLKEEFNDDVSFVAGKHILLVDDNIRACDTNKEMLLIMNTITENVYNGFDAEKLVMERLQEGNPFDLAIIDWRMPEYDGMTLAKKLKKLLGDKCPVMALAAYDWGDIEMEGYREGIKTFISKPFFKSRVIDALRIMLGEKSAHEEENQCDKLQKKDFTGKRALLVEDNELNMEIATELLKMTGIDVENANDGSVAVNMFSERGEHYYDIIFMDIQMPVMNGHEATKAIRMLPMADAKKIPIIAMSANAFMNDIQESKMSGMNEHISKPIDINRLGEVLTEWVG
ncbi:MAG: response regulator [Lachnospiraceae bacterium]|nr:response regulator [Lachnospiraceae bacterium]